MDLRLLTSGFALFGLIAGTFVPAARASVACPPAAIVKGDAPAIVRELDQILEMRGRREGRHRRLLRRARDDQDAGRRARRLWSRTAPANRGARSTRRRNTLRP